MAPLDEDAGADEDAWSRTPDERLAHVEMRRGIDDGEAVAGRLQRAFEVTEVPWS
jgi:hypothetical protein